MAGPERSLYRWERRALPDDTLPPGVAVRRCRNEDDPVLGRLIEKAYAGTIDEALGDNHDGEVEMAMWRDEPADVGASFVAVDREGAIRSASLVSSRDDTVYMAYVFTHPAWKGRGAGAACVSASLRAIVARDDPRPVVAAITDGNTPSERLFGRAGFVRIGPL